MTFRATPLLLSLLLFPNAYSQMAGGGVWAPGINKTIPQYFSGTACIASGQAYCYSNPDPEGEPCFIRDARLTIAQNGVSTEVTRYDWIPGEPKSVTVSLSKMFDSTHFQPTAGNITVTFSAHDNLGRPYIKNYKVPCKNKAIFGQFDFGWGQPKGAVVARDHLAAMATSLGVGNYSHVSRIGSQWDKVTWLSQDIVGANFIYTSGHGASGVYHSETSSGFGGDTDIVSGSTSYPEGHCHYLYQSIGDLILLALNGQLPPHNPSGVPPLNFMFIDACNTMQSTFTDVLYPELNLFSGSPGMINQAVAGYTVTGYSTDSDDVANYLFSELSDGRPVKAAIDYAVAQLRASGKHVTDSSGTYRLYQSGDIVCQGDPYTKVAGVYTGTNILKTTWY